MKKFLKKCEKSYFGAILGPFSLSLVKKNSWKKGLCQFLNTPINYYHAKHQKKNNEKEC